MYMIEEVNLLLGFCLGELEKPFLYLLLYIKFKLLLFCIGNKWIFKGTKFG
jgi:hypothetical protein